MGKYMKKPKTGGDVAVMEVSSPPIGVRTRAKTLALKKSSPSIDDSDSSSFAYLQLRSRRLRKVLVQLPTTKADFCGLIEENLEPSFGENTLDVQGRDRSTRESTPCSLIRDSNTISTPGSTTRQRTSTFTNQISIPAAYEMEEFFAYAETQQQALFMDKYNFDIVNDVPLPGRYEWVQVHH